MNNVHCWTNPDMAYDPTRIAAYLEGADFPATGGELAGVAAGNDAPRRC